jgi:hypothetical protein
MKRQIFTLLMVLVLATGTVLMAQTSPNAPLPPSQQVDQSGQPEQPGHPDVDVDTGKNANNGVLNVDVKRNGDADTKAGNNPNGNKVDTTANGTAGQYNGTSTSTTTTTTTGSTVDTGSSVSGSTASNLPRTASDTPLVGLIGLLALAGALALRSSR